MAWENEWTSEWMRKETLFFLIFLAETRVYNTIEQRYACILCFKVCTCTWWYSRVNGMIERCVEMTREREREVVSLFFFSFFFFFNFLVFWKNRKQKKIDRKRSRTQIETHFLRRRIFSYHVRYYSEPKKTRRWEDKDKIKEKVRRSEERNENLYILCRIHFSLQTCANASKAWKGMKGGRKGGEGGEE